MYNSRISKVLKRLVQQKDITNKINIYSKIMIFDFT